MKAILTLAPNAIPRSSLCTSQHDNHKMDWLLVGIQGSPRKSVKQTMMQNRQNIPRDPLSAQSLRILQSPKQSSVWTIKNLALVQPGHSLESKPQIGLGTINGVVMIQRLQPLDYTIWILNDIPLWASQSHKSNTNQLNVLQAQRSCLKEFLHHYRRHRKA